MTIFYRKGKPIHYNTMKEIHTLLAPYFLISTFNNGVIYYRNIALVNDSRLVGQLYQNSGNKL